MIVNTGGQDLLFGGLALLLIFVGLTFAIGKIRSVPLRVLIVVGCVVSVVMTAVSQLGEPHGGKSTGPPGSAVADGLDRLRITLTSPQVLVDEDVVVRPGGWQVRGVTFSEPHVLRVVADGKAHADKGFDVYVLAATEFDDGFAKKKPFHSFPSFEATKVKSFTHTDTLPAGSWDVLVRNSQNADAATVHLEVTSDPK